MGSEVDRFKAAEALERLTRKKITCVLNYFKHDFDDNGCKIKRQKKIQLTEKGSEEQNGNKIIEETICEFSVIPEADGGSQSNI